MTLVTSLTSRACEVRSYQINLQVSQYRRPQAFPQTITGIHSLAFSFSHATANTYIQLHSHTHTHTYVHAQYSYAGNHTKWHTLTRRTQNTHVYKRSPSRQTAGDINTEGKMQMKEGIYSYRREFTHTLAHWTLQVWVRPGAAAPARHTTRSRPNTARHPTK